MIPMNKPSLPLKDLPKFIKIGMGVPMYYTFFIL